MIELVNRLDPTRYRCHIASFKGGTPNGPIPKHAEIFEVGFRGFFHPEIRRTVRELRDYCVSREIDLVQSFFEDENLLATFLSALDGYRNVISVRNMLTDLSPLYNLAQRYAFRRCNLLLANSVAVRDRVLELSGVPEEKVRLCHNGVDLERFRRREETRKDSGRFRRFLGLPADRYLFGVVANLREVKNHAGLFHALSELKKTRNDFTAVLAGTGPLRNPLEELSRKLGISENVLFLGQLQDIPSFLSAMDAGVLNSRHEGFPNALLEYMAAGLPVVATAVGGCKEIVLDEVTGYLVPPQDESALAERLRALLNDLPAAERMGVAGRKRAETEFSMDRMVSFHDSIYRILAVA